MDTSMVDKNTCSICLGFFKQPKTIECHHAFCLSCLQDYTKQFTSGTFPCPLCRHQITIPEGGIQAFADNFYIDSCTDAVATSCSNHQGRKADLWCNQCYEAICFRCVTVKHNGHLFLDLEDEKTMEEVIDRTVCFKDKLALYKKELQSVKNSLDVKYSQLNTSTQTAQEKIDARVEQICDDVRRFGNLFKTFITSMSKVQQAKLDTVSTQIEQLSSDVEFALNLHEETTSEVPIIKVLSALKLSNDVIKKQSTVNLSIPEISFPAFNTDDTNGVSAEQIGQCTTDKKLRINTTFDFKDIKENISICSPDTKITEDLSCCLAAVHDTTTGTLYLYMHLELPENIASCNTCYSITLHSSVTGKSETRKTEEHEFVKGGQGYGWRFINWATLIDQTNGFIDKDNKLTVSAPLLINNINWKDDASL